ncbi:MAG: uridine kinase [Cryobacterium sp.]|nr:uridine kinase [Cryobacterium sp.]
MARWAPLKKDTLGVLADEILHNYGQGRSIVAVDGRHGAGQAAFADDLAAVLRPRADKVFRASMDDFFKPRFDRDRIDDARGYFEGIYDYSLFRRVLVDPYRVGGSTGFVLKGFDVDRDQPVFQAKWQSAADDAILIVDGVFLQRKDLAGLWNYAVWLATPLVAATDDTTALRVGADELYLSKVSPSERAAAIFNNQNPEHPRREFADSC